MTLKPYSVQPCPTKPQLSPARQPVSLLWRIPGTKPAHQPDDATLFWLGQLDRYYEPSEMMNDEKGAIIERFPAFRPLPDLKNLLNRLQQNGEPLSAISHPQLTPEQVHYRTLNMKG